MDMLRPPLEQKKTVKEKNKTMKFYKAMVVPAL